jgi:hypothetical protein
MYISPFPLILVFGCWLNLSLPPFCLCTRFRHTRFLDTLGYGENGQPIGEAFVVGIAGASPRKSHRGPRLTPTNWILPRRLREWKGTTALMTTNICTQSFTLPDSRRTSNRPEYGVYSHRYHPISSPYTSPSIGLTRHSLSFLYRIVSTKNIPPKNLNWLSRTCMISTTQIQSTCPSSLPYGQIQRRNSSSC